MRKPKPKARKALIWHECEDFIEKKYKISVRDYSRAHEQFGEWCAARGEAVVDSSNDIRAAQAQYAEYQAAIASREIIERPYQDFWHFLIDATGVSNGSTITLDAELAEGAEPWVKEILGLFLKEFGCGPYLTEW